MMFAVAAAIVASAFALSGAPPVPVTCTADTLNGARGISWWERNSDGSYRVTRIELRSDVCGGLLLLGADEATRKKITRLNPRVDAYELMGGVRTLLHETHHATGDLDETAAECYALAQLDGFLARYLPPREAEVAAARARVVSAALPPSYHEHPC